MDDPVFGVSKQGNDNDDHRDDDAFAFPPPRLLFGNARGRFFKPVGGYFGFGLSLHGRSFLVDKIYSVPIGFEIPQLNKE